MSRTAYLTGNICLIPVGRYRYRTITCFQFFIGINHRKSPLTWANFSCQIITGASVGNKKRKLHHHPGSVKEDPPPPPGSVEDPLHPTPLPRSLRAQRPLGGCLGSFGGLSSPVT